MKVNTTLWLIAAFAIVIAISPSFVLAEMENIYWNGSAYEQGVPAMTTYSYTAITTDQINSNAVMATNSDGGLDYLYYSNGLWARDSNITGNSSQYYAVTSAIGSGINMFAVRDGALENVYWDAAYSKWSVGLISSNTYTALATDPVSSNTYYAAGSSGLVKYYYSSGWGAEAMSSNVYTDLSIMGTTHMYAIRDGGLDDVYYDGVWNAATINANTYTSVAANVGTSKPGEMLAARDGSLDWMYYTTGWATVSISSDTFVDISQAGTDLFYAIKDDGDLYEISYDGSDWSITLAYAGDYSVVATSNVEGQKNTYVSNIPEPATLALLTVGGIAMFKRIRRRG